VAVSVNISPLGDLESHLETSKSLVRALAQGDLRTRFGHANTAMAEWLDALHEFTLAGHEQNITSPLLIIAGKSDFDPARMEKLFSVTVRFPQL